MSYAIKSIFSSIQCEGAMSGTPMTYVRFAGCSAAKVCHIKCDTDWKGGEKYTAGQIAEECVAHANEWVLITGGEPMDQYDRRLHDRLKDHGFKVALETSGTKRVLECFDYISCSPKGGISNDQLKANLLRTANEYRFVVKYGDPIPPEPPICSNKFLSPEFDGDRMIPANAIHAVNLVKKYADQGWRLSLPVHKWVGIP